MTQPMLRLLRIGTRGLEDEDVRLAVMGNGVAIMGGAACLLFSFVHLLYSPSAHLPIVLTLLAAGASFYVALWLNSRDYRVWSSVLMVLTLTVAMVQNDWYLSHELGAAQFFAVGIPGAFLICPRPARYLILIGVGIFTAGAMVSYLYFDAPQIPVDPGFLRIYHLLCTLGTFTMLGSFYFLFHQ